MKTKYVTSVYGYACRGVRSRLSHKECEDHLELGSRGDYTAIAIADGASAAQYAREGAMVNATAGLDCLLNNPLDKKVGVYVKNICQQISAAIEEKAAELNVSDIKHLSATFAGISRRISDGRLIGVSVGDTAIIGKRPTGDYELLVAPYNIGSKQKTIFTYDAEKSQRAMQRFSAKDGTYCAVFVMTDGAADYFIDNKTTINTDKLDEILSQPDKQTAVETLCRTITTLDGFYDDVSIGVMLMSSCEDSGLEEPQTVFAKKRFGTDTIDSIDIPIDDDDEVYVPQSVIKTRIMHTSKRPVQEANEANSVSIPIKAVSVPVEDVFSKKMSAENIKRDIRSLDMPVGMGLYYYIYNMVKKE